MTVVIEPASTDAEPTPVTLTAVDGLPLGALYFAAEGAPRGRIVVAGATAVPQGFYRRFARFAAARGYDVLTFDYRGIGLSAPRTLRGFHAEMLDWGRLDLPAAIDHMAAPGLPLHVVGHSYGGHAPGLLPNHDKVAGFYVFGTGAGWHGHMPPGERLKVLAMWHVGFPVLTWWKGYCPWKLLGLGEDLPVGVYRQWRRWCGFPHYFFDDPAMRGIERGYAAVRAPMAFVNALDDRWAPPRSREAFVFAYRNAPTMRHDVDPRVLGAPIGHMGYFRPTAEPLWRDALSWFDGLPPPTAA
ncbi:alpha/beta fold hydrolase [Luteimonas sp. FCS-9]|uniref:alpha/beta hydrolase family protein n=1 Tax=Luteimonas sp. FCS-9 TaxID=1547516 RepID=UPI0009E551F6|nr:alpha/beta fold hydrolase [Luteimonas sp. FCS-9]